MYSERIENLIKGALADGVLEEREIAVLRRVATQEGVDPDELQMDVEARLAEIKAKQGRTDKQTAGNVRKCPRCGAVLSGLEGQCPECGHMLTSVKAVSSAKEFAEGLQKIIDQKRRSRIFGGTIAEGLDMRTQEKTYIRTFPVPNTAEDLFEFMITMYNGRKDEKLGDAYKSKFNECYQKAALLFPDHPMFLRMKDEMKMNWWGKLTKTQKVIIIYLAVLAIMFISLYFSFKNGL